MPYSVATSSTPQLAEFLAMDIIWTFHDYIQPTPAVGGYERGDPREVLDQAVDWEAICDLAVATGKCNAISIPIMGSWGFLAVDTGNRMSPFKNTGGTITYPQFGDDYSVSNPLCTAAGVEINYVYNFVKACRSRGIKVGFYVNFAHQNNFFEYGQSMPTGAHECFGEFLVKQFKWINKFYAPDFYIVDLDWENGFTDAWKDALYQAMKTPHGGLVIKNCFEGQFRFPADCKIAELHGLPTEPFWLPSTTVNSVEYYIPSGLWHSGLYSQPSGGGAHTVRWDYWEIPPGATVYNLIEAQSHFNQWYDYAKDRSMPFFCNIPMYQGTAMPAYYDRVLNISREF